MTVVACKPKPDKFDLGDLPKKIEGGDITIPQFQRQYVWNLEDCAKLLDSVFKGYPIGTVTLWMTQERLRQVKKIAGHVFPQAKAGYPVNYVLDGQQRLTSVYVCLRGERVHNGKSEVDYGKVYLLLDVASKEDDLVVTDVSGLPSDAFVSIKDLFECDYNALNERFGKKVSKVVDYHNQLIGYPISTIEFTGADLLEATEIFTRINTTGKRLSVFEVMSARVYREKPHFDLVEVRDCQRESWKTAGYDTLPDYVPLQAMAMCLHKSCTKDAILALTSEEVSKSWAKVDKAFSEAIDYLRIEMRIPVSDLLPYDVLVIPFVYFMYKNKGRKPSAGQAKWLKDYFWRTALTQRFSNAVASKLTNDVAFFDAVLKNKTPDKSHLPLVSLTPNKIAAEGAFKTGSSFIKAILCLFAAQRPQSFASGANVVIDNSWVSKKNAKNYHHFFPRAYMKKAGWKDPARDVDHVANIVIIDSADNQAVKDAAPATYIAMFKKKNAKLPAALKTHLIDDVVKFGIRANDYRKFFDRRIERICEELTKCIVPRKEDELIG